MTTPPVPSWLGSIIDMTDLPAAKAVAFTSAVGASRVVTTACLLLGWSALETSGAAAASGILHDGSDATGPVVGFIGMAAGLAQNIAVAPPGLMCKNGLYVAANAGAYTGVAWVIPIAPGA